MGANFWCKSWGCAGRGDGKGKLIAALVMHEFHYDYMVPKYGENLKLCYRDTDSLVCHTKTKDFYTDITGDVKDRFDTSECDKVDNRPLPLD